ncbi:MAG TPA: hypothetical protein PKL69_13470 [Agitococcus sp.]|nr:hypothetical protein [Agitococcus sp.]HNA21837.1 hypothetical protein [Agitococcus sp.]HNC02487.1 hypothetical protein [Agitococcus sp.]HNI63199.1 hypothetical protein [Agitococcus sp.]HNJ87353.1 hypothetical protein [Agitococcus sp.]
MDYYIIDNIVMNQISDVIIKNHIALAAFDSVGLDAIKLIAEVEQQEQNNEVWLFMALVSCSTIEITATIEWLKNIQKQARLVKEPMLLVIHLNPCLLTQSQQRIEFLRALSDFADSVVLVPQLAADSQAQALARLPQFLINMVFRSGMISLDFGDLRNRIQHGIAVFGYGLQQPLNDGSFEDISAIAEINQQWRNNYLPPAYVKQILACIEGNIDVDLDEYMAIGEQLQQPQEMFRTAQNMALALGMSVKEQTESEKKYIGALFFGLDFEAFIPVVDNLEG